MNFLKNKFELDFTFSKIVWSCFKFSETILLRVLIFACSSLVCLSKYLTGHILLKYCMDLLQIFRNYFLRSLYLQVLPLFVCLSKYLSGLLLQNYWVDWPMLASKYSVISSKYFVLVITYHFSLSFIEIIRALSQGGGEESPLPSPGGRAWKMIYMIDLNS